MPLLGLSLLVALPSADAAKSTLTAGCMVTGNVAVTNTDTGDVYAYLSKNQNVFGESIVTTTPGDYATVTATVGTQKNLTNGDGTGTFPLIGAVVGFANTSNDLGVGSFNYAYLGLTKATPAGAGPTAGGSAFSTNTGVVEPIESAIWTLGADASLTPTWLNSNLSAAPSNLVEITGILTLTGDRATFGTTFGANKPVKLSMANMTASCTSTEGMPSSTAVLLGSSVTDTATVRGTGSQPTGTASFSWCGPLLVAAGCASGGTTLGGAVALTPGSGNAASATSASLTPTAAGIYCFRSSYSGDATHNASTDGTSSECFTVLRKTPSVGFSPAPVNGIVGEPDQTLGSTTDSNGTAAYSVTTPTKCEILSGNKLHLKAAGSCTVKVTVPETAQYVTVSATATIQVITKTAPVAGADSYATSPGATLVVAAPGVLTNDTDAENDALTSIVVTSPTHGSLTLSANGSFTYTSALTFNGTDTFTYKANDGGLSSTPQTVSISVVNTLPSCSAVGPVDVTANTVKTLSLACTDVNTGQTLTLAKVTNPGHGSVGVINQAAKTVAYTPSPNYLGTDSFTYRANDGIGNGAAATVSLNVISAVTCTGTIRYGANAGSSFRGIAAPNWFVGGDGRDTIVGGASSDCLFGQGNKDTVNGERGNDIVSGGDGDDSLSAGAGEDDIRGGAGDDTIFAADGEKDAVDCGAGTDDVATVDTIDIVTGCETTIINNE
ncbi:MAG: repeat-containing protein [Marmoricola sp.]|nr:repeat-containing protein [Marmoricola sp.]